MNDDPALRLEDALIHAVWARNMKVGGHAYSPFQIVHGKSTLIPGISEGAVISDTYSARPK